MQRSLRPRKPYDCLSRRKKTIIRQRALVQDNVAGAGNACNAADNQHANEFQQQVRLNYNDNHDDNTVEENQSEEDGIEVDGPQRVADDAEANLDVTQDQPREEENSEHTSASEDGSDTDENDMENNDDGDDRDNNDEGGSDGDDNDGGESDGDDNDDGESDGDDNEFDNVCDGDRPLYQGATITVTQSMCILLALILKHNLTRACIIDVLHAFNLICPQEELVRLSFHKFRKFYNASTAPARKIYYCSNCISKLNSERDICGLCRVRKGVSYFLSLPLIPQLKVMFKRANFFQWIEDAMAQEKCSEDCMEDIHDSGLFKNLKNLFPNTFLISLLWNSDGTPVYSSKNHSFWAFYLSLTQLPFKVRFRRENVLLAGLWFGPSQPKANLFLESFRSDLQKLYNGVEVHVPGMLNALTVRGLLLAGTCDLPAKCKFMNMTQFNGDYGCPCCETKGETLFLGPRSWTHIYKYVENFTVRTLEDTHENARQALESGHAVMGIKGQSYLQFYMLDYVKGMGIDLMHLLSGVVKKLMDLQFSAAYSAMPFSMRDVLQVVNDRLLSIKPPKFVHRMPRGLLDFCHWKVSEMKLWLFYYSPAILSGVMNRRYYKHYMKLVMGLSYLSSSHVSDEKINKADQLLNEFVHEFETLYGARHCTINIHLLLHLSDCVRNLGPLWAYTCFPFENLNGELLRCVHGTRFLDSQISNMHWQVIHAAKHFSALPEGFVKDFCTNTHRPCKTVDRISQGCYTVGSYENFDGNLPHICQALERSGIGRGHVEIFLRLLKDSKLYVSEMYARDLQTRSSFCLFNDENEEKQFGNIICFIKVHENCCCVENVCLCPTAFYAVVQEVILESAFTVDRLDATLEHMWRCRMGHSYEAIPVGSLRTVCFYMYFDNQSYVANPVNNLEVE